MTSYPRYHLKCRMKRSISLLIWLPKWWLPSRGRSLSFQSAVQAAWKALTLPREIFVHIIKDLLCIWRMRATRLRMSQCIACPACPGARSLPVRATRSTGRTGITITGVRAVTAASTCLQSRRSSCIAGPSPTSRLMRITSICQARGRGSKFFSVAQGAILR